MSTGLRADNVVRWIGEVAAPDGAWALQSVGAGGRAACFCGYVDHGEPVGVGGCSVVFVSRNAVCVARLLTFIWAVLCAHLCDGWC